MNVVDFRPRLSRISLVVFADLQMEYVTPGRRFSIAETRRCLANCRRLLLAARALPLPVAHARQVRGETYFNPHSSFADWIPGFRPQPTEMVFERAQPSLYSNSEFVALVEHIRDPVVVIVGLSGAQACLSTAVGAAHRGHRLIFLGDCSASSPLGMLDEPASHDVICRIIAQYAEVTNLAVFLGHAGPVHEARARL